MNTNIAGNRSTTTTHAPSANFATTITIAVIPDASHALIPEQPVAVVEAIVGWMRTLPR